MLPNTFYIFFLVSAGAELIVFTAPDMRLCFGFTSKPVLITQMFYRLLKHRAKGVSVSQLLVLSCQQGAEDHRRWEGTEPGLKVAKGIFHTTRCHVKKLRGVGWMGSCCWGVAGHWLMSGEQLCCPSLGL